MKVSTFEVASRYVYSSLKRRLVQILREGLKQETTELKVLEERQWGALIDVEHLKTSMRAGEITEWLPPFGVPTGIILRMVVLTSPDRLMSLGRLRAALLRYKK